jgi:hypothetical protein
MDGAKERCTEEGRRQLAAGGLAKKMETGVMASSGTSIVSASGLEST